MPYTMAWWRPGERGGEEMGAVTTLPDGDCARVRAALAAAGMGYASHPPAFPDRPPAPQGFDGDAWHAWCADVDDYLFSGTLPPAGVPVLAVMAMTAYWRQRDRAMRSHTPPALPGVDPVGVPLWKLTIAGGAVVTADEARAAWRAWRDAEAGVRDAAAERGGKAWPRWLRWFQGAAGFGGLIVW